MYFMEFLQFSSYKMKAKGNLYNIFSHTIAYSDTPGPHFSLLALSVCSVKTKSDRKFLHTCLFSPFSKRSSLTKFLLTHFVSPFCKTAVHKAQNHSCNWHIPFVIEVLISRNLNMLQILSSQGQDRCLINCNSKNSHILHSVSTMHTRHIRAQFELQGKLFLPIWFHNHKGGSLVVVVLVRCFIAKAGRSVLLPLPSQEKCPTLNLHCHAADFLAHSQKMLGYQSSSKHGDTVAWVQILHMEEHPVH